MATPRVPPHLAHVLVVDDTDTVRRFIRRVLEDDGYSVHEAADGLEALSLLDGGISVDLVITDIRMPRMAGPELAEKLASRSPGLPTLFVSAYDAHAGPMDLPGPVVPKPFLPDVLLAQVGRLLYPKATLS